MKKNILNSMQQKIVFLILFFLQYLDMKQKEEQNFIDTG